MKTCKQCRWWIEGERVYLPRKRCECPAIGKESPDSMMEEGMQYYHEGLYSGPDFGCIHFQEILEGLTPVP